MLTRIDIKSKKMASIREETAGIMHILPVASNEIIGGSTFENFFGFNGCHYWCTNASNRTLWTKPKISRRMFLPEVLILQLCLSTIRKIVNSRTPNYISGTPREIECIMSVFSGEKLDNIINFQTGVNYVVLMNPMVSNVYS